MKDILKQIVNHIEYDSNLVNNFKFDNEFYKELDENKLNFNNKIDFKFNVYNIDFSINFNHKIEDEELKNEFYIVGILSWKFNHLGNEFGAFTSFNQEIIDIEKFKHLFYIIKKQIKQTYLSICLSDYYYEFEDGSSIKEKLLNYIDKL